MPDKSQHNFLRTHRVFNTDEWERDCSLSGYRSRNQLAKLSRNRRIRKIRNGLYAVLPEGAEHFTPPALLTAAKLTPDAVLGYRSALAFYGLSRNAHADCTFLSRHRIKPCRVNNTLFQPCLPPKSLADHTAFLVETHRMLDTPVRVVAKERLLVDSLDRPDLSGGWEEISNAFMYEDDLDWDKMLQYARILKHPATAARLGFFLEKHKDTMMVPESTLSALETLVPGTPEHFFRSKRQGRLLKRWNLYVPDEFMEPIEESNCEF